MIKHTGGCHCGRVRFEVLAPARIAKASIKLLMRRLPAPSLNPGVNRSAQESCSCVPSSLRSSAPGYADR